MLFFIGLILLKSRAFILRPATTIVGGGGSLCYSDRVCAVVVFKQTHFPPSFWSIMEYSSEIAVYICWVFSGKALLHFASLGSISKALKFLIQMNMVDFISNDI